MPVWRIIGLGIIAGAIVLLVFGLQATDTVSEELRQEVTGEYSDRTTWYIVGGIGMPLSFGPVVMREPSSCRLLRCRAGGFCAVEAAMSVWRAEFECA